MRIDCHAHVSAPQQLWAYKAGLLAARGTHGRGAVAKSLTDDQLRAAANGKMEGAPHGHLDYIATLGIYIAPGSEVTKMPVPARLYWPAEDTLPLWTADTVFTASGGGVRVWRYRPPGDRAR